ncbi:helix-turn-helix transcriptional regulator [Agromyces sp. MMS24-JH15]|uniref:helix-turn-helix transcriptional regulator n=1 Tax=Agromyces sp. MMS24-JH15 TaxID=3243765 RepID=UPI00374A5CFC
MAGESKRVSGVANEDRHFSLVLALIATEQGLLKADILSTVRGYAERYAVEGQSANLERQFERDKDILREVGIPLEVIESPDASGDNTQLRYRIPKGRYEIPEDVRFTPQEFALLGLAAEVWREESLSEESQRALTKLRGLGTEPSEPLIGLAPRLRVREPAFGPLQDAADRRRTVSFRYLKPGDSQLRERLVDPHVLLLHEGRWLLHGYDHWADGPRTFLLSRISGQVRQVQPKGHEFRIAPADAQERLVAELERIRQANTAELKVSADSDAEVRLGRRAASRDDDAGVIRLHFTDQAALADELAGYGPEVQVLAPEGLRAQVIDRLRAVLDAHRGEGAA